MRAAVVMYCAADAVTAVLGTDVRTAVCMDIAQMPRDRLHCLASLPVGRGVCCHFVVQAEWSRR